MVVGKDVATAILSAKAGVHLAGQVELLFEPERQRLAERAIPARCKGETRFEQPFEFGERLVIEADEIEVGGSQAGFRQAVVDGVLGEPLVMLPPGKPLFLGGGY